MPAPNDDIWGDFGGICIDLFQRFAAAALADDDAQLLASVVPQCVCAQSLTSDTTFDAFPAAGRDFPKARGNYRLMFRHTDITDRIVSWASGSIRFTLPPDSKSGFVYLTQGTVSAAISLGHVLANLCGIPDLQGPHGQSVPLAPAAVISVIRPPMIEFFNVNGIADAEITTEACSALEFSWSVYLEGSEPDQLVPPGCEISIQIIDETGQVHHQSNERFGHWTANPPVTATFCLVAKASVPAQLIRSGQRGKATPKTQRFVGLQDVCGQVSSSLIRIVRQHKLHLEPREPHQLSIVAGKSATLSIRISCPAPATGLDVFLHLSDYTIIDAPASVSVSPGELSAVVSLRTFAGSFGQVFITATAPNHLDDRITYEVVENSTAIVLSGGGAKGSFQVGALLFLREIWHEISPSIVCGTSVGAINALAVAGSLTSSGVDTLESVWLALEVPADMYRPSPELELALAAVEVPFEAFVAELKDAHEGGIDLTLWNVVDEEAVAGWFATGWALAGPVGGLIAGLASLVGETASRLGDMSDFLVNASYLIDLEPVRDKMSQAIDRGGIANSGMKMRLAVVALEDGELRYVTEGSRLIGESAASPYFNEPIVDPDPLVLGAMASAAIPGFFAARPIQTPSTNFTYVDAGVREVLPGHAAAELGAQTIYNLSNSLSTTPFRDDQYGAPGSLLKITKRGIDIQGDEVTLDDMHPRQGFCDGRERVLVHPDFEVHHILTIDPGLIRINIAYGYFRAFDGEKLRRTETNGLQYLIWRLWTNDLISERVNCHMLEERLAYWLTIFDANLEWALPELRDRKNRIGELIVERYLTFGADAFPRKLLNGVIGDQSVLDWCGTWERHSPTIRAQLDALDLWAPQSIMPGSVGGDAPGHGPVLEAWVQPRFPLPQDVLNGLMHR
ncbi:patatin-like phospholipase family protein [Paracraurococcus lichenis]|uniref:Patatin-like phospholipase family protein n=1 Tax=Paracraurococcus lichenis TaxID=3064888 RepID=A0ABT9EDB6_9PROT|nr:patatin-like phospholipase family protein [Paracraurococcus sp. LOR1-02]MDO9714212.1 patatin-like phospholipase family protein [Paracraurococcus sp. LOR1-02]